MKLAVMQPYFFPYIGYFQLINAVDKFVFYDDVNFIKNGWINRNRILIKQEAKYITIQLKGASSFKQINEIEFTDNRKKILKSIEQAYTKAPYYNDVIPVIRQVMLIESNKISELAISSVKGVCKYLDIDTSFEVSSQNYRKTKNLERTERLKEICKLNNAVTYINAAGGQELYDKTDFLKANISLKFLHTNKIEYNQNKTSFIPSLSMIDVLMWNDKNSIHQMLNEYCNE